MPQLQLTCHLCITASFRWTVASIVSFWPEAIIICCNLCEWCLCEAVSCTATVHKMSKNYFRSQLRKLGKSREKKKSTTCVSPESCTPSASPVHAQVNKTALVCCTVWYAVRRDRATCVIMVGWSERKCIIALNRNSNTKCALSSGMCIYSVIIMVLSRPVLSQSFSVCIPSWLITMLCQLIITNMTQTFVNVHCMGSGGCEWESLLIEWIFVILGVMNMCIFNSNQPWQII